MDNQTGGKDTNLAPAIEPPAKRPFKAVKYILIFAIGILAAKILFSLISKTAPLTEKPTLANKKEPLPIALEQVSAPIASFKKLIPKSVEPSEKKSRPELVLNGIAASGSDGWAIINERIVKVGDTVKGAKIVGISADRVDLEFDKETFSLLIK